MKESLYNWVGCHHLYIPFIAHMFHLKISSENLHKKDKAQVFTWMFPKIGVGPQNGWFIMENLILMIWGCPYFRKHPHGVSFFLNEDCQKSGPAWSTLRMYHSCLAWPKTEVEISLLLWKVDVADASSKCTLPEIGHPKRKVVFQPSICRCYVSFREGSFEQNGFGWDSAKLLPSWTTAWRIFLRTAAKDEPKWAKVPQTHYCQESSPSRFPWNLRSSRHVQDGEYLTALVLQPQLTATERAYALWCHGDSAIATWGDANGECSRFRHDEDISGPGKYIYGIDFGQFM